MTLADFTTPALMIPRLVGSDVPTILQELSQALQREGHIPDMLPFYHAVLNREFLGSTDLEPGIAFPHARLAGPTGLRFALGRTVAPVAWAARNKQSVRLVFLLAVPADDSTRHLQVISGLARFAREARLIEQMHGTPDAHGMFEVLRESPVRSRPRPNEAARTVIP